MFVKLNDHVPFIVWLILTMPLHTFQKSGFQKQRNKTHVGVKVLSFNGATTDNINKLVSIVFVCVCLYYIVLYYSSDSVPVLDPNPFFDSSLGQLP